MPEALGIILLLAFAAWLFEYRVRKPDQIVLFEKSGKVKRRKGNFYPRHFSISIQNTTHSMNLSIESEAKGKISVITKLAVTVAISIENIQQFVKVGGWSSASLENSAKEFNLLIQGEVRKLTEKNEVEKITPEIILKGLNEGTGESEQKLGLEIISMTVQSVDTKDEKLAETIRERESAKIMEKTEEISQNARIVSAEKKLKADRKILQLEHELELKKFQMKNNELEVESKLAEKRLNSELKRNRLKLELEKEEIHLLKENPELLMLTPQIARLAEASQNLKNAKTVINLGSQENESGNSIIGLLQTFLSGILENNQKK